jgi:hypothetical protein
VLGLPVSSRKPLWLPPLPTLEFSSGVRLWEAQTGSFKPTSAGHHCSQGGFCEAANDRLDLRSRRGAEGFRH